MLTLMQSAVYTAAGKDKQVETLCIERVRPRALEKEQLTVIPPIKEGMPDLIPVPNEQGLFCKTTQESLIVTVKNQGTEIAGPSMTKVDFREYGSTTKPTPSLNPGKSVDLLFKIPMGCFDSDCEFDITVDVNNNVVESEEGNNTASGTCTGQIEQHTLLIKYVVGGDLLLSSFRENKETFPPLSI